MAYNGWSNYETWAVKLWLDNDEGAYHMVRDHAASVLGDNTDDETGVDDEGFARDMAGWLREYHADAAAAVLGDGASVFHDLLNAALADVDWREIGAAYLEDAKEAADA